MDDEEPNHDNSGPASRLVRVPLILILSGDGCNDKMASSHSNGSDEENGLTAESVDPDHGGDL